MVARSKSWSNKLLSSFYDRCHCPIELCEDDNSFVIIAELPGVSKDDINISVDNGVLIIEGEKKSSDGHYNERLCGTFYRALQLPDNVDRDNIDASYNDGLLTVAVPKAENKHNRIMIK